MAVGDWLLLNPDDHRVVRRLERKTILSRKAAGEAAHYVFTLTDASGDVVFTNGQPDTTLMLPPSVGLSPGAQYFWVVDALLDGARFTSTDFQGFVVERR